MILLVVGFISLIAGLVLDAERARFEGTPLHAIGELFFLSGLLALGIVILYALSWLVHKIKGN